MATFLQDITSVLNPFATQGIGASSAQRNPSNAGIAPTSPVQTNPVGNIVNPAKTQTVNPVTSNNTSPGGYKGVAINAGSQADIQAQMKAIDAQQSGGGENVLSSGSPVTNSSSSPITNPADTPFKIDTTGTNSSALSGGTTANDVLTRRQQMENTYMEAYNKYAQAVEAQKTTQVQNMGNINNALYSGDTTDFGQGAAGIAQNAANISNALAEIKTQGPLLATQGMSNMLGFMNQDIQNQLATVPNLQNVQQAADGSIIGFVRDPMTGKVTSQNFGNPLLGTFSNEGQTGANIGGGSATTGTGAGAINLPQNNDGTYQTANGGSVDRYYAQKISSMPQRYQSAVFAGPQGVAYIDENTIKSQPDAIRMDIQNKANAAGIPILTHEDTLGLQAMGNLYQTLDSIKGLADMTLRSGVVGKGIDTLEAIANKYTGYKPILENYNVLRDTAGKAVTALMGGIGSGFRMNQPELEIAASNLPTADSNIEQANVRLQAMKALLDKGMQQKFPSFSGVGSLTTNGAVSPVGYTGNTISAGGYIIPTDF